MSLWALCGMSLVSEVEGLKRQETMGEGSVLTDAGKLCQVTYKK